MENAVKGCLDVMLKHRIITVLCITIDPPTLMLFSLDGTVGAADILTKRTRSPSWSMTGTVICLNLARHAVGIWPGE